MIEFALEYMFCVIDFLCFLYFYLILTDNKWNWKKAIPVILLISFLQMVKDVSIDFGGWSIFVDSLIVIGFLFIYSFQFKILYLIDAMLIYSVMICCVAIFVGTSIELSIDVSATLTFGWERLVFTTILKIFTVIVYLLILHPLKVLKELLSEPVTKIMFLMIAIILSVISYVYGNSVGNERILYYVLFTLFIFICILYLIYHYCIVLKENENLVLIQHTMKLTAQYTKNLENEFEQVREMRHDMKNQLLILSNLQNDERYEEVKQMLSSLTNELDKSKTSISGNIYIDAVLRQKQAQYKNIKFDYSIALSKDFQMEGTDLVSLLSNIIDNACEELNRIGVNAFQLKIKGNKTKLEIAESNLCRNHVDLKTDKNKEYHGFGLKIIKEIVKKYNGEIYIETEGNFVLHVILTL